MAVMPRELTLTVHAEMAEVKEAKVILKEFGNILKECKKDARQLGLSKRQVRGLIRTISRENSSYRKHVKDNGTKPACITFDGVPIPNSGTVIKPNTAT
jgi:hypothetical protein